MRGRAPEAPKCLHVQEGDLAQRVRLAQQHLEHGRVVGGAQAMLMGARQLQAQRLRQRLVEALNLEDAFQAGTIYGEDDG